MFISVLRFVLNGWVYTQYILPQFYFTYYGFGWVHPLPGWGMYLVFALMALAALGIMFGARYRLSAGAFFLLWTYVELLDKTNYLNHYYFVTLMSFLLIWVPAHGDLSWDAKRNATIRRKEVPAWTVDIFKWQLAIVYFFAGVAKLNADWLLHALPLKIWLPAQSHLPIIGPVFKYVGVAYLFSLFGAFYDLTIPFFLYWKKTRAWAYVAVVLFHVFTAMLFQIGMFPYIMVLSTLIFFSPEFHQKLQGPFQKWMGERQVSGNAAKPIVSGLTKALLSFYFLLQVLIPMRYLLYPGNLFWNEEGYRFSWRVMLMEKAGYAQFVVTDRATGKQSYVTNEDYLTPVQIKMMATQPDMLVQFAHYLAQQYKAKGIQNPVVQVQSRVILNGRGGQSLVDPQCNLAEQQNSWAHKSWIKPLQE